MDANNLADVWIRLHHLPKESSEHEALFWSWEKLTEMCDSAPETAWNVIQEIIARSIKSWPMSAQGLLRT